MWKSILTRFFVCVCKTNRKAGGKCNGPPGLRPQYMPTYYAAFVHDPIGNNLEVVCCGISDGSS